MRKSGDSALSAPSPQNHRQKASHRVAANSRRLQEKTAGRIRHLPACCVQSAPSTSSDKAKRSRLRRLRRLGDRYLNHPSTAARFVSPNATMHRSLAARTLRAARPRTPASAPTSTAVPAAAPRSRSGVAAFHSNVHQENQLEFDKSEAVDEQGRALSETLHENAEYLQHQKNQVRASPVAGQRQ